MTKNEIKKIVTDFKQTCTVSEGEAARLRFNQEQAQRNRERFLRRNSYKSLFYESQFTYGSGARWTARKHNAA